MSKLNTVKEVAKKIAENNNSDDYIHIPIGADSDNIDRPNGNTVEESLTNLETTKIEIIQVTELPVENIKLFPTIYALIENRNVTLYEYKNNDWIPYGGKPDFVGTMAELEAAILAGDVVDGMTAYIMDYDGSGGGSSGSGGGSGDTGTIITIKLDSELSETSENGVQNKIITNEFKKYLPKTGGEIQGVLKVYNLVLGTTPSTEIGAIWIE